MSSLAVLNIGVLASCDPANGDDPLGRREDAAVVVEDGRVAWVGAMRDLPELAADRVLDAGGRCVLPGFVDSHTHLVFAGDRADDFLASTSGEPYEPGGIERTVRATRDAGSEALAAHAHALRAEALRSGTTTIETKSGYGLTLEDERRCCAVARAVADVATFLGAHVVPLGQDEASYVELVTGPMLEACAPDVGFVDVFCEQGAFGEDATRAVLRAGRARGLRGTVHANQLGFGPGVRVAVEEAAASASHCTYLDPADVEALAASGTVATLLPIAEFATRTAPADGRRLLDAGCVVALASNCNPGSSYSTSMPLAVALAVRCQGLAPDEAVLAATRGGAAALALEDAGRISLGARGDLVVLDAPDPLYLAYRPGVDLTFAVVRAGEVVFARPTAAGPR